MTTVHQDEQAAEEAARADATTDMADEEKKQGKKRQPPKWMVPNPETGNRMVNARGLEDELITTYEKWLGWLYGPQEERPVTLTGDREGQQKFIQDRAREYLDRLDVIEGAISQYVDHRDRVNDRYLRQVEYLLILRLDTYRETIARSAMSWPAPADFPATPTVRFYPGFPKKYPVTL